MRTSTGVRLIGSAAAVATVVALSPLGVGHAVDQADPVDPAHVCAGATATIVGTDGDDVLVGTEGPDVIVGLGGNDTISGLGGDDVICGGDGDDVILGGDGDDVLLGGAGADQLRGGAGADVLHGGAGDDDVRGGTGPDRISVGTGDDVLHGNSGHDCLDLQDTGDEPERTDADAVEVSLLLNRATGWSGTDTVSSFACVIAGQGPDTVQGNDKDNVFVVPAVAWTDAAVVPPNDSFTGAGGKDTVELRFSSDVDLEAGTFVDTRFPDATAPYGGTLAEIQNATVHGAGILLGDAGNNVLTVTGRVDGVAVPSELYGRAGNDVLVGGAGDDVIKGGPGRDNLRGRGGDDTMSGSGGDDIMRGGAGDDVMRGKGGDDWISGSGGDDDILGGRGRDEIFGRSGDDVLRGGKGRDRIDGGGGQDTCTSPSGPPLAKRCN